MRLYLDTETYNDTPIKHGTYKYTSTCEVIVITWAVDDGPVRCWTINSGHQPTEFLDALVLADEVVAHNAMFDRAVLMRHFPDHCPPVEKWRCTMVKALGLSLPGSLDKLCDLFKVDADHAKLKDGKTLVLLFCKPRPRNMKLRRATAQTHPEEWARFVEYAMNDIEAMRVIDAKMPKWNASGAELELWRLDQRINDRGFAVDLDQVHSAVRATDREQLRLDARTREVTGFDELTGDGVAKATQRDAMLTHILEAHGLSLPDLRASTIEQMIDSPEYSDGLKELLSVRLQSCTTSAKKYLAVANGQTDGRLRGTLQFCGAQRTGRWAGRTFQPQNLPRPALKNTAIEQGIDALKAGCEDLITDNVMQLVSSAIRGCIVAPAGRKLVVADLSNIEGRVLAWLAGEEWKIKAFADFDNGVGHDLYALAYAKAFGVSPDVVMDNKKHGDGHMRQVGKVMELALGYEGGIGAFITFASAYSIDLEAMGETAYDTLPDEVREQAERGYAWAIKQQRNTFGLSERAWVTCDSFKRLWRQAHPNVVAFWSDLGTAVKSALAMKGNVFHVGALRIITKGNWLRVILPSGRSMAYPNPKVVDEKISYAGMNQFSHQWGRIDTYGGKLAENVTQAVARDVLAYRLQAIEDAGYPIVLTVHDEVLTEPIDSDEYSAAGLADLMATQPAWAAGLPLAAAGFEAYRYRKD